MTLLLSVVASLGFLTLAAAGTIAATLFAVTITEL